MALAAGYNLHCTFDVGDVTTHDGNPALVEGVRDRSGNFGDSALSQSNISDAPIWLPDQKAVSFTRERPSNFLDLPATLSWPNRSFTVFAVVRFNNIQANVHGGNQYVICETSGDNGLAVFGPSPVRFAGRRGGTTFYHSRTPPAPTMCVVALLSATTAGGGTRLYINRTVAAGAQSANTTVRTSGWIARNPFNVNRALFNLYELVFYSSALSIADTESTIDHLLSAWSIRTEPKLTVVLLGDSNTQGATGTGNNGVGWVVDDAAPPHVWVKNIAIGANRASDNDTEAEFTNRASFYIMDPGRSNYLLTMLGGQDISAAGETPATTWGYLTNIASLAADAGYGFRIISTILPNAHTGRAALNSDYIIPSGLSFFDRLVDFTDEDFAAFYASVGAPNTWYSDNSHLNADGSAALAARWLTVLEPLWTLPAKAAGEYPAHASTGVALTAGTVTLSWTETPTPTDERSLVYGGTDPDDLVLLGEAQEFDYAFDWSGLSPGTTYYWRVDRINEWGTTPGDVWSFTAAAEPAGSAGGMFLVI